MRHSMFAAAALVALAAVPVTAAALPVTYAAVLSGAAEAPPNSSLGTGFASVIFDVVAFTMNVHAVFSGLSGVTTASHIHCCTTTPNTGTAGVATSTPTFTGFPGGVTAGTYDHLFDLNLASSWNPAFISANGGTPQTAAAAFGSGLAAGRTYFNIHTSAFGGGEIRGFLQAVPEPSSIALVLASLAALGLRRRPAAR